MEKVNKFNISEYFDEFDAVLTKKIIECNTQNVSIHCEFYKACNFIKAVCIPESEFLSSKIQSVLERHSIFPKSSLNLKKRKECLYRFFQYLAESAEKNVNWIDNRPGLTVAADGLTFYSTENLNQFIHNCYAGFSFNQFIYYNDIIHKELEVTLESPEAALLLTLRYCALMMPLKNYGFQISFPYLLVFSNRNNNQYVFNTLHSYLKLFNKNFPVFEDINQPLKRLETVINPRQNNFVLLNAMMDSDKIRNENINFLRDNYIKNNAQNLCAVMSNTIQDKLDENEYIQIDLSDADFSNQLFAINSFNEIDSYFIHSLCYKYTLNELHSLYQKFFSSYCNQALNYDLSVEATNVSATILAVYSIIDSVCKISNTDSLFKELSDIIYTILSDNKPRSDEKYLIKIFRNELESQINSDRIRVLDNKKSNCNLSIPANVAVIYTDNSSILIPSEVFDRLCTDASSQRSIEIKRALNLNGYLHFENNLYISKKVIYPPGRPSIRTNVYILNENIIDTALLSKFKELNSRTLSNVNLIHTDENGVSIGKDKDYKPIIWSYTHERMSNSHMLVTGKSGSGKTTFIIQTLRKLADKKEKVVVFDISDSYIDKPELNDVSNVYTDFSVNPFYCIKNETQEECCKRLAGNLASVFRLSDRNYYELIDILNLLYENDHINTADSEKIRAVLSNHKPLIPVLKFAESFSSYSGSWESILSDQKVSVFKMNSLKAPYEKATEFLLNDLYSYMEAVISDKVFIVVDEIQNMVRSDTSAVIKILSQGREKNMALIAATQSFQSIPRKYKSMFLQSGLSVFFQQEITAVEQISKLIHSSCHPTQIAELLKKLKIAECLVYGSFENINHEIETDNIIYCNTDKKFIEPIDKINLEKEDDFVKATDEYIPINFNISCRSVNKSETSNKSSPTSTCSVTI